MPEFYDSGLIFFKLKLSKSNINYIKCIKIVEETKRRLNSNANYDMSIDNMLLGLWEKSN